jgi:CRISPR-associated protein Csm4
MTTWRIRLRPLSPWATPWRADSLFGTICWKWLDLFPETFHSMLEEFSSGETPPFILSDAWPGDLLPLPAHIPPVNPKKLKPPFYIPSQTFQGISAGRNPSAALVEDVIVPSSRIQTSIDREKGAALDGQLFETDIIHLGTACDTLSIYIRSDRFLNQVISCFKAMSLLGFGRKSTTGLGQFQLLEPIEHASWLDCHPSNPAWVSLSHFVPAPTDPIHGQWRTHVTFPKFHANSSSNVFKGTILMLTPGSVFRTNSSAARDWYGSMIPVPRPEMPKALHYGLCFPVPVNWDGSAQ